MQSLELVAILIVCNIMRSLMQTWNLSAITVQAIFIGGGNTFQLLDNLYKKNVLDIIRRFEAEYSYIYKSK